jgi:hypothetical protein
MCNFLLKLSLLITLIVSSLSNSNGQERFKVNTDRLNLRPTIGSTSIPLGYVQKGDTVNVIDKSNTYWYKIRVKDKEGFVRSKYLIAINEISHADQGKLPAPKIIHCAFFIFFIICLLIVVFHKKKPYQPDLTKSPTMVIKHKSVGLVILLTFFFGPFGMFYSTYKGGLVMLLLPICLFFGMLSFSDSAFDALLVFAIFLSFFYWLICIIWAAIAASNFNKIIINQSLIYPTSHEN